MKCVNVFKRLVVASLVSAVAGSSAFANEQKPFSITGSVGFDQIQSPVSGGNLSSTFGVRGGVSSEFQF